MAFYDGNESPEQKHNKTLGAWGWGIDSALSLIPAIYKGISGFNQARKGNKLLNSLVRPTYQTPNEIGESLNIAKNQFLDSRLPGQSVAEGKLQSNTAGAIQKAQMYGRTPAEIMSVITGANANENAGFNDLATEAAKRQLQDQLIYQQSLNTSADYKDKEWAYNKYMPYMDDRQYAQDLIGAGNKNLYGAIDDATSGIIGMGGISNIFDKFFMKKGKSPNSLTGDEEAVFSNPNQQRSPYQWGELPRPR